MDIYGEVGWTDMDIEDLKAALENGRSIEEAVLFLCREGTIHFVRAKRRELGLKPKKEPA
jgi:hypothetical protein